MRDTRLLTSSFVEAPALLAALKRLREAGQRELQLYTPVGIPEAEQYLPRRGSPIRFLVLVAGITGCALAFWMCIGSAELYGLFVGAKPPASVLPYCVIGFELTVLLGGLTAFFGVVALARLRPRALPAGYLPEFSEDRFGLVVSCAPGEAAAVARLLREAGAEEVHGQPVTDRF
jgi:hypothetical protein